MFERLDVAVQEQSVRSIYSAVFAIRYDQARDDLKKARVPSFHWQIIGLVTSPVAAARV